MSEFARLAALARHAVDAVHGEAATLQPMERAKGPHGSSTPSGLALPMTMAFFHDTDLAARHRARPLIKDDGAKLLNRSPEIYGSTAFAGEIGIGDMVARIATGEVFEVTTRDRDGIGNIILGLASIKA